MKVLQIRWEFQRILTVESYLFYIFEQMKLTLLWVCRVLRRSKLIKIHIFKSLPKPLRVSKNIDIRKLLSLYLFPKTWKRVVERSKLIKSTFFTVWQNCWQIRRILVIKSYWFYTSEKWDQLLYGHIEPSECLTWQKSKFMKVSKSANKAGEY